MKPSVAKGEVDAFHRGDELYVKVGAYTRSILLPAALRRKMKQRGIDPDARKIKIGAPVISADLYGAAPLTISATSGRTRENGA